MVVTFSALGYKIIRLHRENLEEATCAAGDRITETVKRSTRSGMLNNRSDEIDQILRSIGSQPGIEKISIFNKSGEIRSSTDEHELFTRVDKSAEACSACHVHDPGAAKPSSSVPHQLSRQERTRIFTDANGHRTLSVINPIDNEPVCSNSGCHAHSADTKVLGMINVRMSLDTVDAAISASRRQMLVSLAGAVLLLSALFGTLIWTMVHRPVRKLIAGTNHVAAGELDFKISIRSRDEVGELAQSFNRMTGELKRAHVEINEWNRGLEERVEKKTLELQQAHAHVLRVEKLASIGKLAAIVAHEINNPLAGILVYARLVLKRFSRNGHGTAVDEETKKNVETIAAESARCGEIVKGLLQFSRQTKPNVKANDLNAIVEESLRLVRHKIDLMGARVIMKCEAALKPIECDEQQIKQALVALLINACEAVHPDEGVITISSHYDEDTRAAEVRLTDNGVGMEAQTREHIFEPFFTTKEQVKGVGLGLAVVYGIVTGHGGQIEVESSPGCGTTFVIRLPDRIDGPQKQFCESTTNANVDVVSPSPVWERAGVRRSEKHKFYFSLHT
ncbi:MAG TPA: ATP-binding protein [Pyrinomonadaceae bacterium]|jgi:two-component system NtrC family sensor kinase|nr:ATP-binding protein [Pyrinomonadaceae bacterium]